MTTLRLPETLAPKHVDELIDSQTCFDKDQGTYYGEDVIFHFAFPVKGSPHRSSFSQQMIDLKEDSSSGAEDVGYVNWGGSGDAMRWLADWTDQDTEDFLNEYFDNYV